MRWGGRERGEHKFREIEGSRKLSESRFFFRILRILLRIEMGYSQFAPFVCVCVCVSICTSIEWQNRSIFFPVQYIAPALCRSLSLCHSVCTRRGLCALLCCVCEIIFPRFRMGFFLSCCLLSSSYSRYLRRCI